MRLPQLVLFAGLALARSADAGDSGSIASDDAAITKETASPTLVAASEAAPAARSSRNPATEPSAAVADEAARGVDTHAPRLAMAPIGALRAGGKVDSSLVDRAAVANVGDEDDSARRAVRPSAKLYVALASIANASGRAQSEVEAIVLKSFKGPIQRAGIAQLAPAEASRDARTPGRPMKAVYLAIAVDRFDYSNGSLSVKVNIGVLTYPGRALIGTIDKTLTKEGVSSSDRASEDLLMEMATSSASQHFAESAAAFL